MWNRRQERNPIYLRDIFNARDAAIKPLQSEGERNGEKARDGQSEQGIPLRPW